MLIFENESLDYLLRTGKHCIHRDYYNYLNGSELKVQKQINGNRQYHIGIIVPNYNNEQWIDKALSSIEKQIYKNYEVVFIDDVSEDNSVKIAKQYIDRMNINIVELEQKRYNGGARNEGYLHLSDKVDYVYYLDSDDWFTNEYTLQVINDNLQGEPDVLFVGVAADYNGIIRSFYSPKYRNQYDAILGWSGCYGMVVKKELAIRQECLFPEGTLKEDRTQHYKVCLNMKSFKCLESLVYVWNRNNVKSVTTERGIKWKSDTIRNWADSIEIYETYKGKDARMDQILLQRIENCKMEVDTKGDEQR